MDSFQAKIGWEWPKTSEKKKKVTMSSYPFRFIPTRRVIEKSKKIENKIQKIKKIPLWLHFKPE